MGLALGVLNVPKINFFKKLTPFLNSFRYNLFMKAFDFKWNIYKNRQRLQESLALEIIKKVPHLNKIKSLRDKIELCNKMLKAVYRQVG